MKNNFLKISVMLLFGFCLTVIQAQNSKEFTELKGDYLGQTPPGETPVVFASGIISMDSTVEHGAPAFSPDGNEVFWQSNYRQRGKETQILGMTMRREGNKWMVPEKVPYGGGFVFSTDGKRLYFNCKEEEGSVCYIQKQGETWSEQKNLGLIARFPELKFAYNLSITNKSTLYFLGYAKGYKNNYAIYRTQLVNGEYLKPELLPLNINTPGDSILNWTPYIAPDESYLIFARRRFIPKDDYGDLYICFQNSDKTWTNPIGLGEEINSKGYERFPSVSPDGKYLFFTRFVGRGNEDVFWVSAKIIDTIMQKQLK